MFRSKTLLSLILCSSVCADILGRSNGVGTLSITRTINQQGGANFVEADRARAQSFMKNSQLGPNGNTNVTNAQVIYTAQVGVGSPPTYYTLIVDTGSSNTWVGAGKPYTKTGTSNDTGNVVAAFYGSGAFYGKEWTDTVTLSSDLVIQQQSIGVANVTTNFNSVDGILGVGPVNLTRGTVANTGLVPTVSDNLYSQGNVSQEVLGVYFIPESEQSINGSLTFGGVDRSAITSPVNYVPVTTKYPASNYWGIDQSIHYGGNMILNTTAGIVDTGTTLIYLATDAFQRYQNATGSVLDQRTGFLTISASQYANIKSLSFRIGDKCYDLSPNGQIWPRSLNTAIGGNSTAIYLVVNDLGSPSNGDFDFINGYAFLERFYSVFDTSHHQVGFATTHYTDSNSN